MINKLGPMIFVTMMAFLSVPLSAAPRVNNGGGGWICKDFDSKTIRWIKMNDLHAVDDLPYKFVHFSAMNATQIFEAQKVRAQQFSRKLAKHISEKDFDIFGSIKFVDHSLTISEDNHFYRRPDPSTCENGILEYSQIADYIDGGSLLIDSRIWNHQKMSEYNKAVLLTHEYLYKIFRSVFPDKTSNRALRATGLLFLEMPPQLLQTDLDKISEDINYADAQWIPAQLSAISMTCTVRVQNEFEVLDFKEWKTLAYGESIYHHKLGLLFTIVVGYQSSYPVKLEIYREDDNSEVRLAAQSINEQIEKNGFVQLSQTQATKSSNIVGTIKCWNSL